MWSLLDILFNLDIVVHVGPYGEIIDTRRMMRWLCYYFCFSFLGYAFIFDLYTKQQGFELMREYFADRREAFLISLEIFFKSLIYAHKCMFQFYYKLIFLWPYKPEHLYWKYLALLSLPCILVLNYALVVVQILVIYDTIFDTYWADSFTIVIEIPDLS